MTSGLDKMTTEAFTAVHGVSDYIDESIFPMLQGILSKTEGEQPLYTLYCRVVVRLRAVKLLNHEQYYETIGACERALFELAVDHILYRSFGIDVASERMSAWELWQKYRIGRAILQYYQSKSLEIPSHYVNVKDFVCIQEVRAKESRKNHCPKGKWDRWTGNTLEKDAEEAEQLASIKLSEYYTTRIRFRNWDIHGSGAIKASLITADAAKGDCVIGFFYAVCTR